MSVGALKPSETFPRQLELAMRPPNATHRSVSKNARRQLRRNTLTLVAWGMVAVNFPIFVMSDVVGVFEFALPTVTVDARVTGVESFGPWHHKTSFAYETALGQEQESSWSSARPDFEVGTLIHAEHQESDLEHARVVGQRKGMITLWQALILPLISLLFFVLGFFRGRGRIKLAQTGTLTDATPTGETLVFEIVSAKGDAGYRDIGSERREVHVPIPNSMTKALLVEAQKLIYDEKRPDRALVLQALGLSFDANAGLDAEARTRTTFAVILVPYLGFLMLLFAYYAAN